MASADADSIVVYAETLPPSVRLAVVATCERLRLRLIELSAAEGTIPALESDPLLVIAGLPSGTRSVPALIGSWSSQCLPGVPLCLFTEEVLVRPSIWLHHGELRLAGAPLGELRVAALLTAWVRERQRPHGGLDVGGTSAIGGKIKLSAHAVGPHIVGSFIHETDAAHLPTPWTAARVGMGAVAALTPRALPLDSSSIWDTGGGHEEIPDSVVAMVSVATRSLSIRCTRDDVEVRLSSPDRAPATQVLRDVSIRDAATLHVEPNDIVIVSWPRGAVSTELVGHTMLDGIAPLLAAFESIFRTSPSAFAAAAIQVR